MPDDILTLTDEFGDDLEIRLCDDGSVSIEPLADAESWDLSASEADRLRKFLGAKTPNAVLASQVSFNEGLIRFASVHDREVSFTYVKSPGRPVENRRLVPTKVTQHDGHVNFFGYDPDRGDVRQFRSDRIRGEVTL